MIGVHQANVAPGCVVGELHPVQDAQDAGALEVAVARPLLVGVKAALAVESVRPAAQLAHLLRLLESLVPLKPMVGPKLVQAGVQVVEDTYRFSHAAGLHLGAHLLSTRAQVARHHLVYVALEALVYVAEHIAYIGGGLGVGKLPFQVVHHRAERVARHRHINTQLPRHIGQVLGYLVTGGRIAQGGELGGQLLLVHTALYRTVEDLRQAWVNGGERRAQTLRHLTEATPALP